MDLQDTWHRLDVWVESLVPLPAALAYKLLWSAVIVLVFFFGRRLITRVLVHRAESEQAREVAAEVLPTFLGLSAFGALIKVWLVNKTGVWPEITGTLYVAIFYFTAKKLVFAVLHLSSVTDKNRQYVLSKYAGFILGGLALAALVRVWIADGGAFSTYLGLLSAGIAISLQDVIASGAAWLYLLFVRPFAVGDRVRIGELAGDVVDMRAFHFSIHEIEQGGHADQPTGRIVHVPNRNVFRDPVANYNEGFDYIWNEIPVMVTYESDWARGKELLEEILNEQIGKTNKRAERQFEKASRQLKMRDAHLEPTVWVEAAASGVTLTMRYLCEPSLRRDTSSKLWIAILGAFANEKKLELAYPTERHV